jgi:hypothetical protein
MWFTKHGLCPQQPTYYYIIQNHLLKNMCIVLIYYSLVILLFLYLYLSLFTLTYLTYIASHTFTTSYSYNPIYPKTLRYLYNYNRAYPFSMDPKFLTYFNYLPPFAHASSKSSPIVFPYFARIAQFPKLVPKSYPNNPPTLTCGSFRATQAFFFAPFHVAMNFSKFSFVVATFSFAYASRVKIPSIVYTIMGFFILSALSLTSYFTMPCVAASSFVTRKASSCRVSRFCMRVYCSILIWFISRFIFLFLTIESILFVCGRVLIVYLIF